MQERPQEAELNNPERQRVLVAVMNNRRDFDIAREQQWYRIPVARAPAQVAAEYLAFYFTSAFGPDKWSVTYYAPVRRFRIVTRLELLSDEPDHPRAERQYYKIEIGELIELPHPIPSRKLRRITFIPTTLDRLLHAAEINDLWYTSLLKERLWEELQRSGVEAEREYVLWEGRVAYVLDFALLCRAGNLGIECRSTSELNSVAESSSLREYVLSRGGWELLSLSESELKGSAAAWVEGLRRRIGELGGILPVEELAEDW